MCNGEMDWLAWNWDDRLKEYVTELTESADHILIGRKMTEGFISYWSDVVAKPDHLDYSFPKKMIGTPKVVFTKTLNKSKWVNTDIATGDLTDEINKPKETRGKGHHCIWWGFV